MSTDAAKLKRLLTSVGYTGQISERKIAASFEGREDVLRFLSTELTKENYVSPDKVRRLEELKRKEAARHQGGLDDSDSGNEMDDEPKASWETTEGVLEVEDCAELLQKRAQEDLDVSCNYQKKKKQLESLEKRLRRRIESTTERWCRNLHQEMIKWIVHLILRPCRFCIGNSVTLILHDLI